ncbi:MAG: GxxExxY protein [Lewinellaceae bacterium]|nr:GxxExxY protein [Lewinellaceae bacterium]
MNEIIYKEESYRIIGLCMEVHNNLGAGFLEIVYKDALEYEFKKAISPMSVKNNMKLEHVQKFYKSFHLILQITIEILAKNRKETELCGVCS